MTRRAHFPLLIIFLACLVQAGPQVTAGATGGCNASPIGLSVDGNTLALWRFDESSGDAIDATGSYTLTEVGGVDAVNGRVNGARALVNSGEAFTHAGAAGLRAIPNAVWSVEALVYLVDTTTGGGALFALEHPTALTWGMLVKAYSVEATTPYVIVGGSGTTQGGAGYQEDSTTETKLAAGWHYVAVVCPSNCVSGSSGLLVYVNGQQVASQGAMGSFIPQGTLTGGAVVVGANYTSASTLGNLSNMYIDELRISTSVRTAAEIRAANLNYTRCVTE